MEQTKKRKRGPRLARAACLAAACLLSSACLILDGTFHEHELSAFSFTVANNPSLRLSRVASIDQDERRILISIPNYCDASSMAPDFSFGGAKVLVDGREQISGQTKHDFSKPLVYTVLGKGDQTSDYAVTAQIVLPGSDKSFDSINIGGVEESDDGLVHWSSLTSDLNHNFSSGMYAPNLSRLYVQAWIEGWRLTVQDGGAPRDLQVNDHSNRRHDSNFVDFSSPVTFTLIAEDGSSASYVSHITKGEL